MGNCWLVLPQALLEIQLKTVVLSACVNIFHSKSNFKGVP